MRFYSVADVRDIARQVGLRHHFARTGDRLAHRNVRLLVLGLKRGVVEGREADRLPNVLEHLELGASRYAVAVAAAAAVAAAPTTAPTTAPPPLLLLLLLLLQPYVARPDTGVLVVTEHS